MHLLLLVLSVQLPSFSLATLLPEVDLGYSIYRATTANVGAGLGLKPGLI